MCPCPASYAGRPAEVLVIWPAFLLPFGCRRSLLGSSSPRWGIGPSLRSAYRAMPGPHRDSTFRTHELQPGWVPSLPRGRRCSHGRSRVSGRRLPHPSGNVPAPRSNIHHPGLNLTRHHRGFTAFTLPVFPWPVVPGWNGHPRAFPRSFAPRRYQRRTSGWGQALSTGLGLRSRRHESTLLPTSPLVSCDLVSHRAEVACP